jgi:hypothetical protein
MRKDPCNWSDCGRGSFSTNLCDAGPTLGARHRETLDTFDRLVRRADLAHTMCLHHYERCRAFERQAQAPGAQH